MSNIAEKKKFVAPVILLHWLMALMIFALYAVGLSVDSFDKPLRPSIVNAHVIVGLLLLVLLVFRVVARVSNETPAYPASMGPMFRRAAAAGHGVLYLLMLATPIAGIATFLPRGRPLSLGLFEIPSPFEANRDLAHQFGEIHELLAHLLIATVVAHALVALYHQFVLRDGILERMRP
ncbi:cytochrome b [Rhodoblastus acidophilus]|uniref:Cytochrome b n=1 Tax=Candidatus Rhodoblastus alkanivorans TaxID=2954117 RepID=A0ABS9Z6U7_9HYPH|nr:cytochrome b [Candidatus Rhodoblastus alkanivorans]MCI4680140.1 cytochrome b [Candidatus Rhodoblastus alkanivorans]MCI4683394.1 cytochrome b [Candidatus Rhodoblastus alkanivorans]MDI4640704.1 cytochrome b [Rhodoblastus acidophilus]